MLQYARLIMQARAPALIQIICQPSAHLVADWCNRWISSHWLWALIAPRGTPEIAVEEVDWLRAAEISTNSQDLCSVC